MNDGGPAFPHTHIIGINGMLHDTQSIGGMSLRAYFAGLALEACRIALACEKDCGRDKDELGEDYFHVKMLKLAIESAKEVGIE